MLVVGDVEGVLRFRIICERAHTVRSSWRKNKKKTRCRKCLVFNGHEKSSTRKIFPFDCKIEGNLDSGVELNALSDEILKMTK